MKEIKTKQTPSESIENIVVDYNNKPIVLQQWEKDVLDKVCSNTDINIVWILTGRKAGATTLCKWLHWSRTDAKCTYLFSNNLEHAKSIKNMPINVNWQMFLDKDHHLYSYVYGVNWIKPITLRKFINNDNIDDVESSLTDKLLNSLTDEKNNYHFMYDTCEFDKLTYNTLLSFNPKLFTICLPYKEFNKVKDILERDKEKDNVVIVADGDLTLYPEWLETSGLKGLYSSTEKIYKI